MINKGGKSSFYCEKIVSNVPQYNKTREVNLNSVVKYPEV
jgi:hypothetical protein